MNRIGLYTLGLVVAFLSAGVHNAAAAGVSGVGSMVPYRALYDVSLSAVKSGQLIDIRGTMYFEWKKTCDSWITDHRSALVYEYADGTSTQINSNFAAYESLDGNDLSFSSRRLNNGSLMEEFRGHAKLGGNADGVAKYSVPDTLSYTLPKGTFFPMRHTDEILARARRGEKFFNAALFDGSDDKGPQYVNVFIGGAADPLKTVDAANKAIDSRLLQVPGRHMRLAFFPSDEDMGAAEYEMDMVAADNGVVSDIDIVYDSFTIRQKLVALQALAAPACAESSAYDILKPLQP